MIVQDHVMQFKSLTEFDSSFLLRNINQTMLLDLLETGNTISIDIFHLF